MLTRPLWPVVEYALNYDYIVNELCENRDEPEMQCNGKCYLTKQLAKESSGKEENPFSNRTGKTEIPQILIFERITEFVFNLKCDSDSVEGIAYNANLYNTLFTSKILHPPRLG